MKSAQLSCEVRSSILRRVFYLLAIGLLSLPARSASALTIELNDVTPGGMSASALSGFTQASNAWESLFTDDITLRLDISFQDLGGSILGQANSETFIQTYDNVKIAMSADSSSVDDATAISNLPAGSDFDLWTTNHTTGTAFLDNDGSVNNFALNMTRANAKALGLSTNLSGSDPDIPGPHDTSVKDGSVAFNSTFSFDFDPSNGVSGGTIDFIGVAIHEIGHALGFVSGVDTIDALSNPNKCSGCPATDLNGFAIMNTLDLFRYSTASVSNNALSAHQGDNAKFSIDGGSTFITDFSTGPFDGDGRQASHWQDSLGIGILDPTFGFGEVGIIKNQDIQAFDVIGWDKSAAGLNDSQITVTSGGAVAFGRVMVNSSPTAGTISLSKSGNSATTFGSLPSPNFSVSETGAFAGGNQTEDISIDITNGVTTTGDKNYFVVLDNTAPTATVVGRGSLDSNDFVDLTATAVDNRVVSTTTVNFGSVFAGAAVTGNSTLSTTGADSERTRVTVNGTAVAADSNGIGVDAASGVLFDEAADTTARTLAGSFSTAGSVSGSRPLSVTGEGLTGESVQAVSISYNANVLDHGTGSFLNTGDPDNPQSTLLIDFGTVLLNDPIAPVSFDIFNLLDTVGFTAGVDFAAPNQTGDFGILTTTLQGLGTTTLGGGNSQSFTASFDTSSLGLYEASYTLDLADQAGITGAGNLPDLVLTLRGNVVNSTFAGIPEPTTGWMILFPALLMFRRRKRS